MSHFSIEKFKKNIFYVCEQLTTAAKRLKRPFIMHSLC